MAEIMGMSIAELINFFERNQQLSDVAERALRLQTWKEDVVSASSRRVFSKRRDQVHLPL